MATLFLTLLVIAYITLGLPDAAWGTAWPFMRETLAMPLAAAGIFTSVVTVCSAVSAALAPKITEKVGTGFTLAVCSLVTGVSILGISFANAFWVVVLLGVLLGFAGGGVDVSVNNFVADHYSSRIMNWVHAAWGLGGLLGPLILTAAMTSFGSWRNGFQTLAAVQLFCSLILFCSIPMWKKHAPPLLPPIDDSPETANNVGKKNLAIFLSVAIYFVYCGVEASTGYWLNSLLIESRGFGETLGGGCVSLYYGAIMVSRVLFGMFSSKFGNKLTIYVGLGIAVLGAGLFFISSSVPVTFISVFLIGFGFGPIYPCNMHETRARFTGDTAKKVVGLQVGAACIGMLCVEPLIGVIMQYVRLEMLPVCVAVLVGLLGGIIIWLNFTTKHKKPVVTE